jgi:hypothetical protein
VSNATAEAHMGTWAGGFIYLFFIFILLKKKKLEKDYRNKKLQNNRPKTKYSEKNNKKWIKKKIPKILQDRNWRYKFGTNLQYASRSWLQMGDLY